MVRTIGPETRGRMARRMEANSAVLGHIRRSSRSPIEQEGLGSWYQGCSVQTACPNLEKAKR
jgi:hypothetical protein